MSDIDRWIAALPLADVIARARTIIEGAGLVAYLKYGNLHFEANGGDMASFGQAKDPKRASLMLMRAGQLHGKYPSLDGDKVKYLRFTSVADVDKKKPELVALCAEWIGLMSSQQLKPSPNPRKKTKKKPTKKATKKAK